MTRTLDSLSAFHDAHLAKLTATIEQMEKLARNPALEAFARQIEVTQQSPIALQFKSSMVDLDRLIPKVSPPLLAFVDSANAASERLNETLQSFVDSTSLISRQLTESVRFAADSSSVVANPLNEVIRSLSLDASRWLPASAGVDAAERTARRYDAIFGSRAFSGVLEDLQPLIDVHRRAILEAPDEPTRRLRLDAALRAVLKGATGLETPLDTPEKIIQFFTRLLRLLVSLAIMQLATQHSQRAETARLREHADHRKLERAQSETIAALSEAMRQLKEQVAELAPTPTILLEISDRSILRAGPSAETGRLMRLRVGQRLKLLDSYGRWRYVEVLDKDGHGTEMRGWIYRRNIRVIR